MNGVSPLRQLGAAALTALLTLAVPGCCQCDEAREAWADGWALELRLQRQDGAPLEAGSYALDLSFDGSAMSLDCRVDPDQGQAGCDEVGPVGTGWELEATLVEDEEAAMSGAPTVALAIRIRRLDETRCGDSLVGPAQLNVTVAHDATVVAQRSVVPAYEVQPGSDKECGFGNQDAVVVALAG